MLQDVGLGPQSIVIALARYTLFSSDLFDAPLGGKPHDLVEGRGYYPHLVNPWSAKDHIISRWVVKNCKGYVQVYSPFVDRESDVSNGELLLSAEANKYCRAAMNVKFIDLHLL